MTVQRRASYALGRSPSVSANTTAVVPAPVARKTRTTWEPTSASDTSRRIVESTGRAIRQVRPPGRCGNANATSWPRLVWIFETGPAATLRSAARSPHSGPRTQQPLPGERSRVSSSGSLAWDLLRVRLVGCGQEEPGSGRPSRGRQLDTSAGGRRRGPSTGAGRATRLDDPPTLSPTVPVCLVSKPCPDDIDSAAADALGPGGSVTSSNGPLVGRRHANALSGEPAHRRGRSWSRA